MMMKSEVYIYIAVALMVIALIFLILALIEQQKELNQPEEKIIDSSKRGQGVYFEGGGQLHPCVYNGKTEGLFIIVFDGKGGECKIPYKL